MEPKLLILLVSLFSASAMVMVSPTVKPIVLATSSVMDPATTGVVIEVDASGGNGVGSSVGLFVG